MMHVARTYIGHPNRAPAYAGEVQRDFACTRLWLN